MDRLALWTGLAFTGGLVLGALLLGGASLGLPDLSEAPAEDVPRLAGGVVTLQVVNDGQEALDVDLEVRDDEGRRLLQSDFPLGPGGAVSRRMISPVVGAYEAQVSADGVRFEPEAFHTDECGGALLLTFRVRFEAGAVRMREPLHECA